MKSELFHQLQHGKVLKLGYQILIKYSSLHITSTKLGAKF